MGSGEGGHTVWVHQRHGRTVHTSTTVPHILLPRQLGHVLRNTQRIKVRTKGADTATCTAPVKSCAAVGVLALALALALALLLLLLLLTRDLGAHSGSGCAGGGPNTCTTLCVAHGELLQQGCFEQRQAQAVVGCDNAQAGQGEGKTWRTVLLWHCGKGKEHTDCW